MLTCRIGRPDDHPRTVSPLVTERSRAGPDEAATHTRSIAQREWSSKPRVGHQTGS